MSLIKRGNNYWLDLQIQNRRYRESLGTSNKKLAEQLFLKRKKEIESQFLMTNEFLKLEDFFNLYAENNNEKLSLDREKQRIKKILTCWGRNICLHEIDIEKIEILKNYLIKLGRSQATINRYFALLRMLINRAIYMNKLTGVNPFQRIKFYREESRKRKALNEEEISLILAKAKEISAERKTLGQKYIFDIILLLLNTGMRIGELLGLKKENVDMNRRVIYVEKTKTKIPREIPMNDVVYEVFSKIMPKNSDYIIPVNVKNKVDAFRQQVKRIRKETGVQKFIGFHNLRHSAATILLERGVDILTVQELLGHTTSRVTLGYAHTSLKRKREAVCASQICHITRDFLKSD